MNKPLAAFLTLMFLSFLLVGILKPAEAAVVFTDAFSDGNFNQWSQFKVVTGATQIVQEGVARFIVPPPVGGTSSYSFVVKDGFTSTTSSVIVASQDIQLSNIPNGATQGNSAIFFLYICDSTNLNGNYGNVGVGIDGSSVWSLWIGGMDVYSYIFQTAGSAPVSNTWYHLVLTVNNIEQTVSLEVNGIVVISAPQQQFTNKTHPISLMVGMGEDWWCDGTSLELQVDNVHLDISDSEGSNNPSTSTPASTPLVTRNPSPSPTQPITQTPNVTPSPTLSPSPLPLNPTPTSPLTKLPDVTLDSTILPVTVFTVLIVLVAVLLLLKMQKVKN